MSNPEQETMLKEDTLAAAKPSKPVMHTGLMSPDAANVERCVELIRARCDQDALPELAIVLGSGWDRVCAFVADAVDIDYAELPGFPATAIAGHAGSLRIGTLGSRRVAMLRGRQHAYETGRADGMNVAIRSMATLGCRALLLTNAAGSLDATMRPGSFMLLSDYLNLVQRSPLQHERDGQRFVDMADAYDPALRTQAMALARQSGIVLPEGIYAWLLGPQFETPAEIRMLQRLGAHAVGMSTVPETIVARHAGLSVLGLSMFTNMGCGLEVVSLSHSHTLSVAMAASEQAAALLQCLAAGLQFNVPPKGDQ